MIRYFILALSTIAPASAIPWNTTTIDTGNEVGAVSASAVDAAGRLHFFSVLEDPATAGSYQLEHNLREHGSAALRSSTIASVPAAERPLEASMTVTDDFRVQVAMMTAGGTVDVWERVDEGGSWGKTVVGPCLTTPLAGVNLQKSRGADAPHSAMVFTGPSGGGVHFSEQQADGSWEAPVVVSAGEDTGLAPVLVHTGISSPYPGLPSRVVISYNRAENRIEANRFGRDGMFDPTGWLAAEQVAPAFTPTRLDAAGYGGKIGVAVVSNADSSATNRIVRVQYAERVYGEGAHPWQLDDVALVSEVNADDGERFGEQAAVAFDAAGAPMVAYQRDVSLLTTVRTLDIRVQRYVPGLGWKLNIVDEFRRRGSGVYTTEELALTAGDDGDPLLTYEHDEEAGADGDSRFVLARPQAGPWTLGTPEALADFDYSSAPAICTSDSGAVHLVTNVGTRSFVFGAPIALYEAPVVTTYENGLVTSEQLPSPDELHTACGIATDRSGAVHAIVLRKTGADQGSLHYYKRGPEAWRRFAEVGSSVPGAQSKLKPISVGAAADGRVFVAYYHTNGTIRVQWYDPTAGAWTGDLGYPAINFKHVDLAVREDGEFFLSCFYNQAGEITDKASILTTIHPVTGAPIDTPSGILLLEVGDNLPGGSATSCAFGRDGLPRCAYLHGTVITLARPDAEAANFFSLVTIERGLGEGSRELIELAYSRRTTHILAATTDAGGSLWHHRLGDGGDVHSSPVAETGLEIYRSSDVSSAPRDPIALTLDQFGEPIVAIATTGPVVAGANAETVVLARPADFTDADGDCIPLLLEAAHCLDPSAENPITDTTQSSIEVAGNEVRMDHRFRAPAVPQRTISGGIAFGEFEFVDEVSPDLRTWEPLSSLYPDGVAIGEVGPSPIPGESSCASWTLIRQLTPALLVAHPRHFVRQRIRRNR